MSVETLGSAVAAPVGRSGVLRRLFRDKVAAVAASLLVLIALAAIFAPVIAPYDPYFTDLTKVMQPPSAEHWFGTDNTGRDILSRVLYGTRNTLMLGLVGVLVGGLLGGAVVTETMFSWPGVGRLAVGAIVSSDFPTAQGAIMILAIAFLTINLVVDVLYVYLDPRVQR